jgi:hypothetical protein
MQAQLEASAAGGKWIFEASRGKHQIARMYQQLRKRKQTLLIGVRTLPTKNCTQQKHVDKGCKTPRGK